LRGVSADIDLVTQARVVFVMLTLALIIIGIGWKWNDRNSGANGKYSMDNLLTLQKLTYPQIPRSLSPIDYTSFSPCFSSHRLGRRTSRSSYS
jgi:hypothetical protein